MAKSADAFRTISEVAEILSVPAHVLRFWESRFTQVKPVKRAGGRRYYRPDDIRLLSGIRLLLHDDGMTIKGVQKILREQGVQHVANMAPAMPDLPETSTQAAPGAAVLDFKRRGGTSETPGLPDERDVEETASNTGPDATAPEPDPVSAPVAQERTEAPVPPAAPVAPAPSDTTPVENAGPALPDLPEDPSDTVAAPPGALAALANLRSPLTADLAGRLGAIAGRLRVLAADRRNTDATTGAAAD